MGLLIISDPLITTLIIENELFIFVENKRVRGIFS